MAHPFSSLFVTYDLAVGRFEPADRRTATVRLRDAYLDAWPEVGSPATLREAFRLAVWTGYVTRALTWIRMVEGAPPAVASEWHGHAAAMLHRWQAAHELLPRAEIALSSGTLRPREWQFAEWTTSSRHRCSAVR